MIETYKPSGRFGAMTFPLLAVGIVVAIGLAFVYQLGLYHIPYVYINLVLTVVMGFALGFMGSKIANLGKVRNVGLALFIGICLIMAALTAKFYFQYLKIVDETLMEVLAQDIGDADVDQVRDLITSELTFFKSIQFRAESGLVAGGGAPISGIFMYLIWVIEAGIIGFIALPSILAQVREPYSEKLDQWASEEEVVMTLPVTDQEMVEKIQASTSVDQLLELPIPKTDESNQFAVYRVNSIPGQELEDAYLSVDLLTLTINKEGEQEANSSPLVKHAIFSSEQRKQLIENADLLHEAMAEYRESVEAGEHEPAGDNDAASDA